jgi:hypothetical protein
MMFGGMRPGACGSHNTRMSQSHGTKANDNAVTINALNGWQSAFMVPGLRPASVGAYTQK